MELHALLEQAGFQLRSHQALSGGDINQVYKLDTDQGLVVIKLNSANRYPGMFQAEAQGLQALSSVGSLRVPEVITHGSFSDQAYLLLEYLESSRPTPDFWEQFGHGLAKIHQQSRKEFGLDQDNYIGSLHQPNSNETTAADFYLNQRLLPQVQLARNRGYSLPEFEALTVRLPDLIPEEQPALVHGDLWGGNFMVGPLGQATLIDPAVAYASREMDFGMMHLFGGFDPRLFHSYEETFPISPGWRERLELWQLYYLLVHLNLFGGGYLDSVRRIIKRYS